MNTSDNHTENTGEQWVLPQTPIFEELPMPSEEDSIPEEPTLPPEDPLLTSDAPNDEETASLDAESEEVFVDLSSDEPTGVVEELEPTTVQEQPTEELAEDEEGVLCEDTHEQEPQPSPEAVTETDQKKKPRRVDGAFDAVELVVWTLVIVLTLSVFLFRHSIVKGGSMESTLQNGDHLIISSLFYTPKVGDVIVFEDHTAHNEPLVKRIIATEGQTVTVLSDTEVIVDGVLIEGGYTDGVSDYVYPITCTVSEGHVFVLGDHRNNSSDSRNFGEVPVECILGKVLVRIYPFSSFGAPDALPASDNE